jgi:HSP20 family molecular chaperone IbpA
MKTDVIEEDNDYKLKADLPGFNKEDIGIDLKDGVLTIQASHKENNDEKDSKGKYVRKERREMSYHRSFTVGDDMKPEDINAAYENGVLTVILPKKQLEQKNEDVKRIEIK